MANPDTGLIDTGPIDAPPPRRDPTRPRGVPAVSASDARLTLVEGTTFCISDVDGEMEPHRPHGLFVSDTRVISRWSVRVDGAPVESLGSLAIEPFHGLLVGRALPRAGHPESTVIVQRERFVAAGMREDITVRNFGLEPTALDLTLEADADFADVFQVKDRRLVEMRAVDRGYADGELRFKLEAGDRGVSVSATGAIAVGHALLFRIVVQPGSSWSTSVQVTPSVDGQQLAEAFPTDVPIAAARPAQRLRRWRGTSARTLVDNVVLAASLTRSERDLGALRIFDQEHPEDDVVAAGAPWFMALFGRDSLLTSHMMLPFAPQLAVGTLRTLARLQGTSTDARTEEQPGRILHEVRLGADLSIALGGESVYFGSIDSTPLFVHLCGRVLRWGGDAAVLAELRPAIERALDWMLERGDRDGDGFIEYQRTSDRGLRNQGWKDSEDSMSFSSGELATGPIALAEVQGYAYASFHAAAQLADAWGEPHTARGWRERAEQLKRRFHEAFWMPELGFYAMALDRDKRPLDVVSSNIGHVLWTGIADESVVPQVVDRLLAPDMFTGFGIRTLSSEAARFNPASYHNGSVWPHDTTIVAAGMSNVGHHDAAARVAEGLVGALEAFGGQLPELFCGFSRDERPAPVPYPTSCQPQAWAAAAPFELLRLLLGLHVNVHAGLVRARPVPSFVGSVTIDGLYVAGQRVNVRADSSEAVFEGLPDELAHDTNNGGARASSMVQ